MGSKNFADPASACKLRLLFLKERVFKFCHKSRTPDGARQPRIAKSGAVFFAAGIFSNRHSGSGTPAASDIFLLQIRDFSAGRILPLLPTYTKA
jgi:hypothetical protein